MSGESLEDVKKVIKSLVLAQQNGLTAIALNNEFLETEGRSIPWKSFGANNLFEFLKSLNDIIVVGSNRASETVFFARVDSSIAHIANFVAHQKPQTIKRRNNIVRNDFDKRPCREASPPFVPSPPPPPPLQPHYSPPPQERVRVRRTGPSSSNSNSTFSNTSDRRRESERSDRSDRRRHREPSPMSISPPPRRTPTPEPDRFRNPSPPRHGRSHSFRDGSPERTSSSSSLSRRQSHRDIFLSSSPQPSPPPFEDYEKKLQKAKERRGLPSQSSRSRRSRSPSPLRHRSRPTPPPPSPPRQPRRRSPQTRSVYCQTDIEKANAKKLVSTSCQTEPEKDKSPPATTSRVDGFGGDENEDLNQAYYGANYGNNYAANYGANYNCTGPYNGYSLAPIPDPSYEEDKSRPGFYYDFDAGSHKPIPLIPEWYAHWIWCGWVAPSAASQAPNQPTTPHPYPPSHQPFPTSNPAPLPPSNVHLPPQEPVPQPPLKYIPTTPTNASATRRDPRLARQTALANKTADKQTPNQSVTAAKRKALSVNDYMKARKLGSDKAQVIINEEAQETPETLSNSLDYLVKLGPKRG